MKPGRVQDPPSSVPDVGLLEGLSGVACFLTDLLQSAPRMKPSDDDMRPGSSAASATSSSAAKERDSTERTMPASERTSVSWKAWNDDDEEEENQQGLSRPSTVVERESNVSVDDLHRRPKLPLGGAWLPLYELPPAFAKLRRPGSRA